MAEAFAMIKGTEAGTRIRAAIVDMMGKLELRNWEETAARAMGHVWMTDCDSLYEHLMSPRLNAIENKRLAIDLMALRQQILGDRRRTSSRNRPQLRRLSALDRYQCHARRPAYQGDGSRPLGADDDDRAIRCEAYGRVPHDQREESCLLEGS